MTFVSGCKKRQLLARMIEDALSVIGLLPKSLRAPLPYFCKDSCHILYTSLLNTFTYYNGNPKNATQSAAYRDLLDESLHEAQEMITAIKA